LRLRFPADEFIRPPKLRACAPRRRDHNAAQSPPQPLPRPLFALAHSASISKKKKVDRKLDIKYNYYLPFAQNLPFTREGFRAFSSEAASGSLEGNASEQKLSPVAIQSERKWL
jgi:hypothetical protein